MMDVQPDLPAKGGLSSGMRSAGWSGGGVHAAAACRNMTWGFTAACGKIGRTFGIGAWLAVHG